jgi:hypothetical protein
VSPGHVVYLLSSRRVTTVAKCKPWEDQFPGLAGERFIWFSDFDADVPQLAATSSPEASERVARAGASSEGGSRCCSRAACLIARARCVRA